MIDPLQPDFANTPASPRRRAFEYTPRAKSVAPAVTLVTPYFNTGLLPHDTATSVLRQSFQQWEWLIVDDGSTEADALSVLGEYEHRDPRIRILRHSENRGLSAARNTGFREAHAPYVVLLDSDDLLE